MLRLLFCLVAIPVIALCQQKGMRVEEVVGRAWLVVGKKRERLSVGSLERGSKVVCERGARASVLMPDGSKAVLLPPPTGSVRTLAVFDRTSSGRLAVFLYEGALKGLFASLEFCVVAGGVFIVEPEKGFKRPGRKYIAEVLVRLVRVDKKVWWSVFAIAGDVKVSLGDSGASVIIPENEVGYIRFVEDRRRWEVMADEANEKGLVLRGRDGKKEELAPEESVEVYADKKDKKYGLIVPPPPPPEVVLRREHRLRLPMERTPYEEAGEVQEAPQVTPKRP